MKQDFRARQVLGEGGNMKIPFYARYRLGEEKEAVVSCLDKGLDTDGEFSKRAMEQLRKEYPDSFGMLTSSCSVALETALILCGLEHGDEVIVPSYNFPSAANGVLRAGGTPVFCDIDPKTQNISVSDMALKINGRTKAVVLVHYAGVACSMEPLLAVAKEAGLKVIEDGAQGIGAFYHGVPLGAMGDFGCVSFHYTKNISCGEGGLLLCRSEEDSKRGRCYRVHGTNRDAFFQGECDRYTWVCPGSSTAMSELCAALLSSQLSCLEEITRIRKERLEDYLAAFWKVEREGYAKRMGIPEYASPNGHIFYLRFANGILRQRIQALLLEKGVDVKTHYVPLHLSPVGRKLGYGAGDCPESEACGETLLRFPIHTKLTVDQVWEIAKIVEKGCAVS